MLVTGGTRGGGGPNDGFNDLGAGQPVHTAELWDPGSEQWTVLAAESVDRCYHATAVLLPDATVLSAGGGDYRPDNVNPNDPQDSHRDAQVFTPPYLFKGPRPQISSAPATVGYGEAFVVNTPQAGDIRRVTWVRLPSVTHSFDENQHFSVLDYQPGAGGLTVTSPATPQVCPPGHYMMFLLNTAGVPSVARIVRIDAPPVPAAEVATAVAEPAAPVAYDGVSAREAQLAATAVGTAVTIGITGTCPYGIGACWGGAYEALRRLDGVAHVDPVPDVDDSTAEVFLRDDGLPPLEAWAREFAAVVNGSYTMRGVEVGLAGTVARRQDDTLTLRYGPEHTEIALAALTPAEKIQWNHQARSRVQLDVAETEAYERLAAADRAAAGEWQATVTGPLREDAEGYVLYVRRWRAATG